MLVADSHVNSEVGLIPPSVRRDIGTTLRFSREGEWLYNRWLDFVAEAKRRARGSSVYVGLIGDIVDVDIKNRSVQMVSHNKTIAKRQVKEIFKPLVNMADRVFVFRGTPAHEANEAEVMEDIAEQWDAVPSPEGNSSWRWGLLEWGGVLIEMTHHHRYFSHYPWTAGGEVTRMASDATQWYAGRQKRDPTVRIPDLLVSAHTHSWRDSGPSVKACRAIILPGFCLLSEYDNRQGRYRPPDIGGVFIECHNGNLNVDPVLYEAPLPPAWKA